MKKIAVVFTHPPHGSSSGREGLDAILATSALTDEISVFFIGDGIFQLVSHQNPALILSRHYAPTFGVFALYDITHCYICSDSTKSRGLDHHNWCIDVTPLTFADIQNALSRQDVILTF